MVEWQCQNEASIHRTAKEHRQSQVCSAEVAKRGVYMWDATVVKAFNRGPKVPGSFASQVKCFLYIFLIVLDCLTIPSEAPDCLIYRGNLLLC